MENPIGPVCAFTLYHVMDAEGLDLFPISYRQIGATQNRLAEVSV